MNNWFEIDKDGLARLLERRGKSWIVHELIQNSLDTDATEISVDTERSAGSRSITLTVTDNSSTGFVNLKDSFTLFAPSLKAGNAETRGRFNVGEKSALSLATEATIKTTTGTIHFDSQGRRKTNDRTKQGTIVRAVLRFTNDEQTELEDAVRNVIIPAGVALSLNGQKMSPRVDPIVTTGTLQTEVADEDGIIRRRQRKTEVHLYQPEDDEEPTIFELGMPVCPSDTPFHLDVRQPVPLGIERATVPQAFRRSLNAVALEAIAETLSQADASEPWVEDVIERVASRTVKEVMHKRFGKGVVAADPSDPEASKKALDSGRTILQPRSVKSGTWKAIRKARETDESFLPPAGRVFPSGVKTSPDGVPPVPTNEWSPAMLKLADYSTQIAEAAGFGSITISYFKVRDRWAGCAAAGNISFNLYSLGVSWPETASQEEVDALLIHELAHLSGASDHYHRDFYSACCLIGAKLRQTNLTLR